ncbi:MAG: DUF6702 family protein [Lishizhenia sp.]
MVFLTFKFLLILHSYFFAFAELEYNKESKVYELSISSIAHDFEDHMKKKGIDLGHIEHIKKQDSLFSIIENEVNQGFVVSPSGKDKLTFNLEGFEVDLKDNLTFFLTSNETTEFSEALISFRLMMETFPDQQNKMNFIHKGEKQSLTFINSKPTRKLSL